MSRKTNGHTVNSAIHEAYTRHHVALKRFISRFLSNSHDIEDVSQETFLRAFPVEKGRVIEQPKSFLFRIAKHVALTQLTKKSRQITDYLEDFDDSEVLLSEATVEDELIARETLGIHCEAVAGLPPQCRRVYLMRKVYGMSHKEIAGKLGIAVKTVEKHLIKGVEQCDRYVRERMNNASLTGKHSTREKVKNRQ